MAISANEALLSRRGLYLMGVDIERKIAGEPDEPEDTDTLEVESEETPAIAPVVQLDPRTYAPPARPAPWSQAPARAA